MRTSSACRAAWFRAARERQGRHVGRGRGQGLRRLALFALAPALAACSILSGVVGQILQYRPPEFDVAIERGVEMATADGVRLRGEGILADVAPTVLDLLGMDQPPAMTGRSMLA